jgi:hypothetical protein
VVVSPTTNGKPVGRNTQQGSVFLLSFIENFSNFDQREKMRSAIQLEITFDQVLELVRKLPKQEKIKLTQELEKDGIESKLSALLKTFRSKELSLDTINGEVEIVRQKLYESQKK